jgi:hypothetical protein
MNDQLIMLGPGRDSSSQFGRDMQLDLALQSSSRGHAYAPEWISGGGFRAQHHTTD